MDTKPCKSLGCNAQLPRLHSDDLCTMCKASFAKNDDPRTMSQKYPKYYKALNGLKEIDVYTVHQLFNIQDPSGCIQHASKKLLLSGVRTGGKSAVEDITEARDTLTRFLQLHGAAKP